MFYHCRENVIGSGFNQTNSNLSMSDGKDINNDDPSSCIEEVDKLLEKVDDAAGIKSSSNDGLADNATPDDVLSLIDYWNILYKKEDITIVKQRNNTKALLSFN